MYRRKSKRIMGIISVTFVVTVTMALLLCGGMTAFADPNVFIMLRPSNFDTTGSTWSRASSGNANAFRTLQANLVDNLCYMSGASGTPAALSKDIYVPVTGSYKIMIRTTTNGAAITATSRAINIKVNGTNIGVAGPDGSDKSTVNFLSNYAGNPFYGNNGGFFWEYSLPVTLNQGKNNISFNQVSTSGYQRFDTVIITNDLTYTLQNVNYTGSYDNSLLDSGMVWYTNNLKTYEDYSAPIPPSDLMKAAATTSSIGISWPAATDNIGINSYEIIKDGILYTTVDSSVDSCNVTGLSSGTGYTFIVRAIDCVGNKADSPSRIYYTDTDVTDTVPPQWPDDAAISVSNVGPASVTLAWPSAIDNIGVQNYLISNGENVTATVDASQNRYTVTGLQMQTAYTFNVVAKDTANNMSQVLSTTVTTGIVYNVYLKTENFVVPAAHAQWKVNDSTAPEISGNLNLFFVGPTEDRTDSFIQARFVAPVQGQYRIWARVYNNISGYSNNRHFMVSIDGQLNSYQYSNQPITESCWYWDPGILVDLTAGEHVIALSSPSGQTSARASRFLITTDTSTANIPPAISDAGLMALEDVTAPIWPSDGLLSAEVISGDTVKLVWPNATDNKAVALYKLYKDTDTSPILTFDSSTVQRQLNGLVNGKKYKFRLAAEDSAGNISSELVYDVTIAPVDILEFKIVNTDDRTRTVDQLSSNLPVTAELRARNNTQNDQKVTLFMVLYKNTPEDAQTMQDVVAAETTIDAGVGNEINISGDHYMTVSFVMPPSVGGYSVKAFAWGEVNSMEPLGKAVEINAVN